MRLSPTNLKLALCGLALIGLTGLGMTLPAPIIGQFGIGYGVALDRFVALVAVQGVIYGAAALLLLRGHPTRATIWLVAVTAAVVRLIPLCAPPFLSNDMYRYIWDGWVQAAGINPYRYIPADPHLAFLRDASIYPNINRATYAHTIYPPAAEMVFCAAAQLSAWLKLPAVLGMKFCLLAFEALGLVATIRLLDAARLPRTNILIYCWNPIPVWEFAGSGHVDAIAIGFVALSLLLAVTSRPGRAAAALAAATLTKFLPIILVPILWRRWDKTFAAVFLVLLILLYLPYLSVGAGVLGFLSGYNAQEGIDTGSGIFLYSALAQILPLPADGVKIYLAALALLLLATGAKIVFARSTSPRLIAQRFMLLAGILMVGLSPHYPWYFPWLLIPACLLPLPSIIYLVTASVLLYLNPTHTKLLWPAIVYTPCIALAARDLWPRKLTEHLGRHLAEGETP
jgi:hypothetical protein